MHECKQMKQHFEITSETHKAGFDVWQRNRGISPLAFTASSFLLDPVHPRVGSVVMSLCVISFTRPEFGAVILSITR